MPVTAPDRVLVVEDDGSLRAVIVRSLELAGYEVDGAATVAQARRLAASAAYDIALLDVGLPDGSGLEFATEFRTQESGRPVIFVTARDAIDDRLAGFALGGDDYVVKPFSVAELIARVGAVLRRSGQPAADQALLDQAALDVEDLSLSAVTHEVTRGGRHLDLSPTEFRLLEVLMRHARQVLSKEQLLQHVWGYDDGDTGVVEKFVSQLRRKVDGDGRAPLIHTVRGFGYVLRPPRQ